MDKVFIKNLMVRGVIGISERERSERQDIVINIVLETDITEGATKDDISSCVNYRTVAKRVIAHVESSKPFTVERLAEEISGICLEEDRVISVHVRVEKPGAVRFSESVGVEIERKKNS